tara:strand:- start:455 stop:700 length:246 start_codon:yes stop_codon:yes gene_type:complete
MSGPPRSQKQTAVFPVRENRLVNLLSNLLNQENWFNPSLIPFSNPARILRFVLKGSNNPLNSPATSSRQQALEIFEKRNPE